MHFTKRIGLEIRPVIRFLAIDKPVPTSGCKLRLARRFATDVSERVRILFTVKYSGRLLKRPSSGFPEEKVNEDKLKY